MSLNACVRSTVELLRTNQVFQSKVKFELELAEDERFHAVPAEAMARLDGFVVDAAGAGRRGIYAYGSHRL